LVDLDRHPVPTASRGDIVAGENGSIWRAIGTVYVVSLMKATLVQ
jgi:hypothetical protein